MVYVAPRNTPYNALYGEVPAERGSFLSRPESIEQSGREFSKSVNFKNRRLSSLLAPRAPLETMAVFAG